MKKNLKLFRAYIPLPGSDRKIGLSAWARNIQHAKQLMIIDLQKQAEERSKAGEQEYKPLFLREEEGGITL